MDQPMLVAGTAVLLRNAPAGMEVLLIRRPDRGSFAGAWVFPGGVLEDSDVSADASEVDNAARAAVRETKEEVGLSITALVPLSQWTPPIEAPKRVRTWFYLAPQVQGEIVPAPDEVVGWQWVRPADALAQQTRQEIELFPPTWVTLHLLLGIESVEEALASTSDPEHFHTHILASLEGQTFVWNGDQEHPQGGTGRHRLETISRPWRYLRD